MVVVDRTAVATKLLRFGGPAIGVTSGIAAPIIRHLGVNSNEVTYSGFWGNIGLSDAHAMLLAGDAKAFVICVVLGTVLGLVSSYGINSKLISNLGNSNLFKASSKPGEFDYKEKDFSAYGSELWLSTGKAQVEKSVNEAIDLFGGSIDRTQIAVEVKRASDSVSLDMDPEIDDARKKERKLDAIKDAAIAAAKANKKEIEAAVEKTKALDLKAVINAVLSAISVKKERIEAQKKILGALNKIDSEIKGLIEEKLNKIIEAAKKAAIQAARNEEKKAEADKALKATQAAMRKQLEEAAQAQADAEAKVAKAETEAAEAKAKEAQALASYEEAVAANKAGRPSIAGGETLDGSLDPFADEAPRESAPPESVNTDEILPEASKPESKPADGKTRVAETPFQVAILRVEDDTVRSKLEKLYEDGNPVELMAYIAASNLSPAIKNELSDLVL
ncbi:MAG: hypothetical protein WC624_04735 [Candidatus Margulisiibacteriota bacterium]